MRDDERDVRPIEEADALDRRIDAALRAYAEPPETMAARLAAARILERARVQPLRARRAVWWMGAVAVPACAVLIAAAAALWMLHSAPVPQMARAPRAPAVVTAPAAPPQAALARIPDAPASRSAPARRSRAHSDRAAATPHLPKLAVFPTPRPLSAQEQALVAFAEHAPPAVQRAVLEEQKRWDESTAAGAQPTPAVTHQDQ